MAVLTLLRRSSTTNVVPATTQIKLGELAINTFDGRLFTKKNNGIDSITEFVSTTGTFSGTLAAISGSIDTIPISRGFGGFSGNIGVGTGALSLQSGTKFDNIAIGINALQKNAQSSTNIAIGTNAGLNINNINSGNNIAIGKDSLSTNISGINNIAIGTNSLLSNTATGNIAIGTAAGNGATTGGSNIFVGNFCSLSANTDTNSIVIGNSATGLGSNTTAIGTSATLITKLWGVLSLDSSIVTLAANTFTINKPQGIITCSVGVQTFVVNNTLVTPNSVVICVLRNNPNPVGAVIRNVIVSLGSFSVTLGATPTGTNPIISFTIIATT